MTVKQDEKNCLSREVTLVNLAHTLVLSVLNGWKTSYQVDIHAFHKSSLWLTGSQGRWNTL